VSGVGDLRRDAVVLACAISSGIHAALVPEHLGESAAAGGGFLVAAVALAVVAFLIARNAASVLYPAAAAAVLAGLVVSYVFAATIGVPVLQPEPEAVDALALVTKAIEVAGIAAAASVVLGRVTADRKASRPIPLFLAGLVAVFSALVALAASGAHIHHAHHDDHHSAARSAGAVR